MNIPKLKSVRLKTCKACRLKFRPMNTLQIACSIKCAQVMGAKILEQKAAKAEKEQRAAIRERKKALKTRREWMAEAQAAFNSFIRERDISLPCICCGGYAKRVGSPGGNWDAGHFLSVGSHPELRFDEDNCHKQLKSCNAGSGQWSKKGRVVSEQYRERLIDKIGLDRVHRLEGPHEPKKYTIDELIEIKRYYTERRRELEKDRL